MTNENMRICDADKKGSSVREKNKKMLDLEISVETFF